ncbi:MAG: glycosyltransferase family 4 protein [Gammaproteobacteria bacterium]|nr:glycosyltransferase family 4 protein [Gammaproteobacteria bacterium]
MYWKRFKYLLTAKQYDAVWIQYETLPYLPFFIENLFGLYKNKIIVDYDDAIFHIYDQHKNFLVRCFLNNKIKQVMKHAHTVIVGNSYLEEYAKKSGAKKIIRIPTVVDTDKYSPTTIDDGGNTPIKIGWLGSPSTQHNLYVIQSALHRLSKERHVEYHVMGTTDDFDIPHLTLIKHKWSEEQQREFLNSINIGIMPLTEEVFTQGKCGYKLIQYMAYAKPVLATPIGINTEIVTNHLNGFLCSSENEWLDALKTLASDQTLRQTLGKNGQKIVEEKYSLKANQEKLLSCFLS